MNPIRSAIAILLLAIAAEAVSAEEVAVRDGATARITLSAHELTRIAMTSGVKLARILAPDGQLEVRPGTGADGEDTGDAFVRPVDPTPDRAFSFFVRDEHGATYTLVATVEDRPSHTVLLKPGDPVSLREASSDAAEPTVRRIKALVRAMALGDPERKFGHTAVGKRIPVWRQTASVLDETWTTSADLKGETWTFRNTTADTLRLDETQFTGLYADTRAVAIERLALPPGTTTRVFIVRGPQP
ncbi:MAG: type-F conjugative transfer system secretin TraK [Pseudomonadota bacterium]|nr:type-F conjugative transfer system secretin TraK [Nevskiales bacterium]MEC9358644.1 type-F conjugative transfer system secretin TraK [Pseudomonadota bacterium]